jgi:hypothetical protein
MHSRDSKRMTIYYPQSMPHRPADSLLRQLDQAFDHRSWHGPNLMGALRGLKGDVLVWRPQDGRHNIAELALHAAYWKYRALRLISDDAPRSFELEGSDFMTREGPLSAAAWKSDVDLLVSWHRRFRAAAEGLTASRLSEIAKEKFTVADAVAGVAAHDLYHAGQIQLIRRLYENA